MLQRLATALLATSLAACATGPSTPDLGELYDRVAQDESEERNPVVLIPGVLGSRLLEDATGRTVWGAFDGDYADPHEPDGARLIALPMRAGVPLGELRDGVVQGGALDTLRLRLVGLPIAVNAYVNILVALGIGGYRDEELGIAGAVDYGSEHFTCFQFAYDWRRDVSELAGELETFLQEKRAYLLAAYRRRGIEREVRFDVVAHSMGGLVLRYYLRHGGQPLPEDGSLPEITWAGAELVERAVLVATPSAGSVQAFRDLLQGTKLGPFLPRYGPAIIGTMPSTYQLLPRPRHQAWVSPEGEALDALDPALWVQHGWGLADPAEEELLAWLLPAVEDPDERRRVALEHQEKCLRRARQLFDTLDRPASPPPGTELYLAAGDALGTLRSYVVDESSPEPNEHAPGDGTVLRSSALMDERLTGAWQPTLVSPIAWSRVMFFFEDHLGLTAAPAFIDNLLYLLLEEPR